MQKEFIDKAIDTPLFIWKRLRFMFDFFVELESPLGRGARRAGWVNGKTLKCCYLSAITHPVIRLWQAATPPRRGFLLLLLISFTLNLNPSWEGCPQGGVGEYEEFEKLLSFGHYPPRHPPMAGCHPSGEGILLLLLISFSSN